MNTDSLTPIRILSRPKLSGVGKHVGVQLPNGLVAHRTQMRNELVSFKEFSQGRPVREVARASPKDWSAVLHRVGQTINAPSDYRLLDNNCEHYASFLMGQKPSSPQIQFVGLLVAACVLLAS